MLSSERTAADVLFGEVAKKQYYEGELDDRARKIRRALLSVVNNELTNRQKCYIILYYRDGLTQQQIADKLGVCRSTVSKTILRAQKRIFMYLKYL